VGVRTPACARRGLIILAARRGVIILAAVLPELVGVWLRSRRLGGRVVVRCRSGHLLTMIWIPGASLKSIRVGWWRFQRCPVGRHWSWVTPVRESTLTEDELYGAREHPDIPIL
jgi:hypothetical protein